MPCSAASCLSLAGVNWTARSRNLLVQLALRMIMRAFIFGSPSWSAKSGKVCISSEGVSIAGSLQGYAINVGRNSLTCRLTLSGFRIWGSFPKSRSRPRAHQRPRLRKEKSLNLGLRLAMRHRVSCQTSDCWEELGESRARG